MADEIPQRDNNRPERAGIGSNTASGDNFGERNAQSKSHRLADLTGQCFLFCAWLTFTGFVFIGIWNCTMNITSEYFGTNTTGIVIQKRQQIDHDGKINCYAEFKFKVAELTETAVCDLDLPSYEKIKACDEVPVRYWGGLPACSAFISLPGFAHLNIELMVITTCGALLWLLGFAVLFTHAILRAVHWTKSVVQKVSGVFDRKKVAS